MLQHGRFKKPKNDIGLNITSMMDMFTILLVFLLKNYSAEGSILTNADNLVLPNSQSKLKPQEVSLQLAVTPDMVMVDNYAIVETEEIKKIPFDDPDPKIAKLEDKLRACYAQEEEMVRLGAQNSVQGKIVIQVDKNVPFDVLFKIMNTCGKVGYNNMNFAVMERDE
jgi:biopolymer transport protein ExbD